MSEFRQGIYNLLRQVAGTSGRADTGIESKGFGEHHNRSSHTRH